MVPWIDRGILSTTGYPYDYGTIIAPVRIAQVTDGLSSTLLVGEYVNIATDNMLFRSFWGVNYVFWNLGDADPNAITFETDNYDTCLAGDGNVVQYCRRGWGSPHGAGMNFLYADGHVTFLTWSMSGQTFTALATFAGGEVITDPTVE